MGRGPGDAEADRKGHAEVKRGAQDSPRGMATRLVEAGRREEWTGPVVNVPVWRASTHIFEDCAALREGIADGGDQKFFYGRRGMPTQWALADALNGLEAGAHGTVLYPSGVSAISGALLSVLAPGDRLLITDNAYDPSRALGKNLLSRMGIETVFFDPLDHEAFASDCAQGVAAVLLENPGSLSMEVCDVPRLAGIAHDHDAFVLVDNTWAGPTGFAALGHGCDGSILALTKHVGGHSDLMMGSVTANERLYPRLRKTARELGVVVSPDDAAMALRGLRTLDVRLERQAKSALAIARWLDNRADVAAVACPMLEGTPGHELWQRDFTGGCGLFSVILNCDATARDRVVDALDLFGIGFSWGGFESLALPVDPQRFRARMAWPPSAMGLPPRDTAAIRLSIGLEDPDDLIADLEKALETI